MSRLRGRRTQFQTKGSTPNRRLQELKKEFETNDRRYASEVVAYVLDNPKTRRVIVTSPTKSPLMMQTTVELRFSMDKHNTRRVGDNKLYYGTTMIEFYSNKQFPAHPVYHVITVD